MSTPSPMDVVLQALATLQSPAATVQQRRDASLYLEQLKRGDVHVLVGVSGTLVASQVAMEARIVGFTMLTDLVRARWAELTDTEKTQISQLSYQQAMTVTKEGRAARPLKGKSAVLLAACVRQQGCDAYGLVVPQLLQQAVEGPEQAELACLVLHYISEDITYFDTTNGENKRLFLAALTTSVTSVFPFLCEMLQQHFVLAVKAQQEGQQEALSGHSAVIHAALGSLAAWVEWTPMARVTASNVLDACTFFLTVPDFRLEALDVLKHLANRKRTNEPWAEYSGLMDKVASLLVGRSADMGLLVPPGQLPQGLSQELDWGGDLEEVGRRLVALLVHLCEAHMRCLASEERRLQLLQLLLVFTGHPYLLLPSVTLPAWAQLMREATPGNTTSTGNNAALHNLPQQSIVEVLGPTAKAGQPPPLNMPPECSQALLRIMWELLSKVVLSADTSAGGGDAGDAPLRHSHSGSGASMPQYFDSVQDWKEFCLVIRGHVKVVMRGAVTLYPDQGFALCSEVLKQALASSAGGASMSPAQVQQAAMALDCAVNVLEACLPPLVDQSVTQGQLLEQVVGLMQAVQGVRFTAPKLVALHARCLEPFGRVLTIRPDLAPLAVRTILEALVAIPLQTSGQAPPPARITREWKSGQEGRLALTNVVTSYAKAAPAAFVPHLRALADQVTAMWEAGQLTEGERVLLWEGLLASAGGVSCSLAGELVGWLLTPIAAVWTSPAWLARLTSPQTFIQAYLPIESDSVSNGSSTPAASIGGRPERWALYHQLTLLERAMRRTAPAASGPTPLDTRPGSPSPGMSQVAADARSHQGLQQPSPDYPMNVHVGWCLPAVAGMLRCVHGLAAAEAANLLGPLKGLTTLDEIDKALRVVGEDVPGPGNKETREPRCVAGASLTDARYLLRAIRESGGMIMSLAIQHTSEAALWSNAQLAAEVCSAAVANVEYLDHNHVRLLIRHITCQLCARCPPAYQAAWLLPVLSVYLPHLAARLTNGWAATNASGSTIQLPGSTIPGAGGTKEGRNQQDVDDVVRDVLLREVTREHMQLLVVMTQRPGERPGAPHPTAGKKRDASNAALADGNGQAGLGHGPGNGYGSTSSMTSMGDGFVGRAPRVSSHGGPSLSPLVGGQEGTNGDEAGPQHAPAPRDTPFDMLMQHNAELAQVMISTAISGMCWPDAEAASKAVVVGRFLVAYGLREGGVVLDAVVGPMLQAAIVSLAQVFSTGMQGELLALLRSLLTGGLTHPMAAMRVRATLMSLLQVPAHVLSDFEAQLAAKGGEKEQRALIKQLVAQAGGEEVRKILTVVSKLPQTSAPAIRDQRPAATPADPAKADQDAVLQGAIYKAIFAE